MLIIPTREMVYFQIKAPKNEFEWFLNISMYLEQKHES